MTFFACYFRLLFVYCSHLPGLETNMSAVPYASGESAAAVDRSLRQSLAAMAEAKQCAVLWFGEVMRRRLYRSFGCSSSQQ